MIITRCGRNEVLVVTGCCISGYKCVQERSFALALPGQQLKRLSLEPVTVSVETNNILTESGVPISIIGIVQAKVNHRDADTLKNALEKVLGRSKDEVKEMLRECMATVQTTVMTRFTPEDCVDHTRKISEAVFKEAEPYTAELGMTMHSYVLKEWMDEHLYFYNLHRRRREAKHPPEEEATGLVDQKEAQRKLEEMKLIIEKEAQEVEEEMRLEEERADLRVVEEEVEEEVEEDRDALKTVEESLEEKRKV